ncbi:Importin alpha subunit [Spraguea lophii 42_110]|uniref:Importin subunit alpha n=1 Tax=Spraguea lophii (strain 42_110) TaxID=1358809 RepID=S7W8I3_SPRLO|nr:Importin alpha subunit [Spraguea lophii 42_110]
MHSRSYMYENKSSESRRKEREEQQVELRSQRRENLLNKKRTVVSSSNERISDNLRIMKQKLMAQDMETLCKGVYEFRQLLSTETHPPIQTVLDSGVLPRLVELLSRSCSAYKNGKEDLIYTVRLEAAWAVTNIASGSSEQTNAVVTCGAIPLLVDMLGESKEDLVDQSVWALGNIAGDSEPFRDMIINSGATSLLLTLIENILNNKAYIKILRNCTWLLSNLNRGRTPEPPLEHIQMSINMFNKLLNTDDSDILSDTLWALGYIIDMSTDKTDMVLQIGILERCKIFINAFLKRTSEYTIAKYCIPAIVRLLGNIVTGNDDQTDKIIKEGFLPLLKKVFYSYTDDRKASKVKKEICWIMSNIAAGTDSQVQEIFDNGIISMLSDAMRYELFVKIEASYAITNALSNIENNMDHLQFIFDDELLEGIKESLEALDNTPHIQALILNTLDHGLEGSKKWAKVKGCPNPLIIKINENGIYDVIVKLQDSSDMKVNTIAEKIVDEYDNEINEL